MSDLRDRIADALYTAPAVPTDAGERVARRHAEYDADAVMGVVGPEIAGWRAEAKRQADHVWQLECTLDRVRELHPPREVAPIYPIDTRLGRPGYTECATCRQPYPCPTIKAVRGDS